MPFPKDIVESLVSWTNPQETVNNSELELAGGVVHSDCVAQCFFVKERTTLAQTDYTTLFRSLCAYRMEKWHKILGEL